MGGLQDKSSGGQGNPPRRAGRKPPTPASQKPVAALGEPGQSSPPIPSASPPAPPSRPASYWHTASLLLGVVLGSLVTGLAITFVLVSLEVSRRMTSSAPLDSSIPVDSRAPEAAASPPGTQLPEKSNESAREDRGMPGETPSPPPGGETAFDPPSSPPPAETEGETPPNEPGNASEAPLPDEAPSEQDNAPPPPRGPFDDILRRNRRLPLSKRDYGLGGSAKKSVELAKLFVDNTENCSLAIIGSDKVLEGTEKFSTEPTSPSEKRRSWNVRFDGGSALAKPRQIATFTLDNQTLSFQWSQADSSAKPGMLRYCLLEIRVGDQAERCALLNPAEVDPLTLDLNIVRAASEIPLTEEDVPNKDLLWLDLKLEGFPGHKVENPAGLKVRADEEKDVCTIDFFDGEDNDPKKSFIKVQLGFIYKDTDSELRFILQPLVFMKLLVWQEQAAPQPRAFEITDEFKAELLKRIADSEIAKYSQMAVDQKKRVNEFERLLNSAPDNQREAAQRQYNRENNILKEAENWITTAKTNRERWQKKTELFEKIKSEGRVQFRVYAKMADEEIEIMRSSGFNK